MGIMKQMKAQLFVLMTIVLLASCGSSKRVAYLENASSVTLSEVGQVYVAKIKPHDELTIVVNTLTPSAAAPFNKTVPTTLSTTNTNLSSQQTLQTYLVDDEGNINFPIVGTIKVVGLTKTELEHLLLDKIRPYLEETENPMVTVRLSGFSYSVIGEVLQPGRFDITNEKVNVFEALASAGDMTIYGIRDRVKLIREEGDGKKTIHLLNLNDANIVNSPYYYLQQNDIVYVEPNKAKAQNSEIGSMTTLWFSATSILVSIATLVISLVK